MDGSAAAGLVVAQQTPRRLHQTECVHRFGNSEESRDIGTRNKVAGFAVLLGSLGDASVDPLHEFGEVVLGVFERPTVARSILLHLESTRGDRVGGPARTVGDTRSTAPPAEPSA